jgi:hypothetical protein
LQPAPAPGLDRSAQLYAVLLGSGHQLNSEGLNGRLISG